MSKNLWLPFWINIVLLLCAIPTIKMLPSTEEAPATMVSAISADNGDDVAEEAGPLLEQRDHSPNRYANAFEANQNILQTVAQAVRKMIHLVTGRRNFQVLLYSFFLTALASSDTKLLVQYISKRYEWTFAEVSKSRLAHGSPLLIVQIGGLHALSKSISKLHLACYRGATHNPVIHVLESSPRLRGSPEYPGGAS
jgi:hypothetical protein